MKRTVALLATSIVIVSALIANYQRFLNLRHQELSTSALASAAETAMRDYLRTFETGIPSDAFAEGSDSAIWRQESSRIGEAVKGSLADRVGGLTESELHTSGYLLPVMLELQNVERKDSWSTPRVVANVHYSFGYCTLSGPTGPPLNKCLESQRQWNNQVVTIEFTMTIEGLKVSRLTVDNWMERKYHGYGPSSIWAATTPSFSTEY